MTRAHRFAALSAVLTLVYVLAFFSILPVPLVSKDVADQLIPVVRFRVVTYHRHFLIAFQWTRRYPGGCWYLSAHTPLLHLAGAYSLSRTAQMRTMNY